MAKLMSMTGGAKSFKPSKTGAVTTPLGRHLEVCVRAKLGKPPSLSTCSLMLCNTGKSPVSIELTGAMLLPQGADTQRLFVAGAQDVTETHVTLMPGKERKLSLETCCMDHGKPAPSGGTKYVIGPDVAPSKLVNAGRVFVANKAMERANSKALGKSDNGMGDKYAVTLDRVQQVCWGGSL